MDENTGSIVVGYDGSSEADRALAWAANESSLVNQPLKALMVEDVYELQWGRLHGKSDTEQLAHVERILEEAGGQGTLERVTGTVVPVLLGAGRGASLLVVGSHGHGRISEVMIGSVSQHVATHASCPVVVVRESVAPTSRRIVVGVDGSGGSAAALEFACRRAELTRETVVAIHAWKIGKVLMDRKGQLPADIGPSIEDRERLLSESVAGVSADHRT